VLATISLVSSILGLVVCGILLGPAGLIMGLVSRNRIAKDPTLRGSGVATAGAIVGGIALVLNIIVLVLVGSGRMRLGV
jgi:hypothetical protein